MLRHQQHGIVPMIHSGYSDSDVVLVVLRREYCGNIKVGQDVYCLVVVLMLWFSALPCQAVPRGHSQSAHQLQRAPSSRCREKRCSFSSCFFQYIKFKKNIQYEMCELL